MVSMSVYLHSLWLVHGFDGRLGHLSRCECDEGTACRYRSFNESRSQKKTPMSVSHKNHKQETLIKWSCRNNPFKTSPGSLERQWVLELQSHYVLCQSLKQFPWWWTEFIQANFKINSVGLNVHYAPLVTLWLT